MDKPLPPDAIKTKIVGVTMGPKVGGRAARQVYLEKMKAENVRILELVPEPKNEYDPDAIKLMARIAGMRVHVGYVKNSGRLCSGCGREYEKIPAQPGIPLAEKQNCPECNIPLTYSGLASELSTWIREGYGFTAVVLDFTGGGGKSCGCNIEIRRLDEAV
jgi:hypothetical protein